MLPARRTRLRAAGLTWTGALPPLLPPPSPPPASWPPASPPPPCSALGEWGRAFCACRGGGTVSSFSGRGEIAASFQPASERAPQRCRRAWATRLLGASQQPQEGAAWAAAASSDVGAWRQRRKPAAGGRERRHRADVTRTGMFCSTQSLAPGSCVLQSESRRGARMRGAAVRGGAAAAGMHVEGSVGKATRPPSARQRRQAAASTVHTTLARLRCSVLRLTKASSRVAEGGGCGRHALNDNTYGCCCSWVQPTRGGQAARWPLGPPPPALPTCELRSLATRWLGALDPSLPCALPTPELLWAPGLPTALRTKVLSALQRWRTNLPPLNALRHALRQRERVTQPAPPPAQGQPQPMVVIVGGRQAGARNEARVNKGGARTAHKWSAPFSPERRLRMRARSPLRVPQRLHHCAPTACLSAYAS